MKLTRRSFVAGAAAGSAAFLVEPLSGVAAAWPGQTAAGTTRAAEFTFTQYHNQTADSSLHKRLVEMWAAIRTETGGRVDTQVFAENNKIAGSDPAALKALMAGEIQFFTLMGGILGTVVPVAEVQQVPFAFRNAAHAHQAIDGPLGAYIREEMAAKGIYGFPIGGFDNGMRQIAGPKRAIAVPSDLAGIRMRVPAGQMANDLFKAFGAEPVVFNSADIYDALKTGKADAQENPLALIDLFKLYEVVKYVSMTNHMWSGFNLMAHLPTWRRMPADIAATIDRNVTTYVRLQRRDQEMMNARLGDELARRGLIFNTPDQAPFRKGLSAFYATWKERLGSKCWTLLEASAGPLA